jgi:hypothetical protein
MNDPLEIPRLNAETLIPDAVATASGATARAEGGLWPKSEATADSRGGCFLG